MRRIKHLLLILVFLFTANIVHAHVVMFYKYDPVIYEVSHRSIVIYDRENQKIGLIPQITFRGRPEDFSVVVPTPTAPDVNTVARDVLYEADLLTSSIRRDRGSGCVSGDSILVGDGDND